MPGYVLHRCRTEMWSILDSSLLADEKGKKKVHCIGASTVSPKKTRGKKREEEDKNNNSGREKLT